MVCIGLWTTLAPICDYMCGLLKGSPQNVFWISRNQTPKRFIRLNRKPDFKVHESYVPYGTDSLPRWISRRRVFGFFVSPDVSLTNLKSSSILDSPKEMTFSQLYLMCFCFSILNIRPLGIDWSNVFSKCLYSHALAFVDGLHKWVPINSIKFSLSPCSEVYWLSHWLMSISLRTTSMLTTPLENEGKVWLVL